MQNCGAAPKAQALRGVYFNQGRKNDCGNLKNGVKLGNQLRRKTSRG